MKTHTCTSANENVNKPNNGQRKEKKPWHSIAFCYLKVIIIHEIISNTSLIQFIFVVWVRMALALLNRTELSNSIKLTVQERERKKFTKSVYLFIVKLNARIKRWLTDWLTNCLTGWLAGWTGIMHTNSEKNHLIPIEMVIVVIKMLLNDRRI